MRHALTAAAAVLLSLLLYSPASAKEKERQWQTGKVLDTNWESKYAGTSGSASGSATTTGNTTYGHASGSSTAIYRTYETYVIEAGDYVYVCQERLRWKWSKPAILTVNGPVQFAIEKDHVYIKGEDGKEHDTKLLKKVLKTAKPSPPLEPKN